jgi:ubiquinone/menaquinone biosynthesis C-methylase UbiE
MEKCSVLFAVILAVAVAAAVCGERAVHPEDAWEARHNVFQPPDRVMDSIGVAPGMMVGEVGAGRGRYVVHMARRVGPKGKIYANDIDADALSYLQRRCKRDSIPNVVTILGAVTDPKLPRNALDMVYLINTYHHLEEPVELMRNIGASLKANGFLVIIEHDPEKFPGQDETHVTRIDSLIAQTGRAGYELVKMMTFLERDNIGVFRLFSPDR